MLVFPVVLRRKQEFQFLHLPQCPCPPCLLPCFSPGVANWALKEATRACWSFSITRIHNPRGDHYNVILAIVIAWICLCCWWRIGNLVTHPLTRIWEIGELRKMSAQCPGEEENPILICQQPVIRRSSIMGLSQKVRKLILNSSPGRLRYLSPVFLPNHRWKWPNYLHLGFPHLCNTNSDCQQRPQIARGLKQNEG